MDATDRAIRFLREIDRVDLAMLLPYSTYEYGTEEIWYHHSMPVIELSSPKIYSEAIAGLPEWDQKRIAEAIHNTHMEERSRDSAPDRLVLKTIDSEVEDSLYAEILIHRNQLVAVSTGKGRIQDLDDYYKARHRRIATALAARGIDNPNPFESLWDWYHKWKALFGSYSERRRFINDMYEPLIARIINAPEPAVPAREPTGWERVDRAIEKARSRMESAKHEEDYQTVGLLCREVFISLGQAVYDPTVHVSPDGVIPSATDANRMIEAFFAQAIPGDSNENVRRYAKAALQLAIELQHRRTADFRAATLCIEATSSTANIVTVLSGRRDRSEDTTG
ncbi:MAG: hypothetical protein SGJ26_02740 [Nitrospirota bacterium]|nr:hypothetical protein [Nitrospirota bacterium]